MIVALPNNAKRLECGVFTAAFVYHFSEGGVPRRQQKRKCGSHRLAPQIAKSEYSGFTASVGAASMPAPRVRFVPGSIKMNEPVKRLAW